MRPGSVDGPLISSVELVYQRTRDGILRGKYAPGSQLKLNDLASANNVSLIPVREALRMLEMEGFVETVRNKGARVTELTREDMVDCYDMRIVLEAEALQRSYPNMNVADVAELRRTLDRAIRKLKRKDEGGWIDLHRSLHFGLYEPSGSRWLLRFIETLWDHSERYRLLSQHQVTADEIYAQHDHILTALEENDLEAAVNALKSHLHSTVDVVWPVLEKHLSRVGARQAPSA